MNPDELLIRLVEADQRIRPDRERFILFRVMGSGSGLPVQHPGLDEDGLSAREQDLEDLQDAGYIRLSVQRNAWHFDVTPEGFERARVLRLAAAAPAPAAAGAALEWTTHVLPVLLAVGRAYSVSGRPEIGVTPEEVANELGRERDDALDRILFELTEAGFLNETIGADQSLAPLRMRLTEKGLQVTSGWPGGSADAVLARLLVLIESRIVASATPEERGRWERLRDGLTGVGREAGAEMLGNLASGFVRGLG